ncbi:hypothetical protein VP1G_10391 [Cytospora mali]|uniref:Uncharacterized protein n=1 Tax=Cytospora mali TaxID=578113 RepID=A0A194VHA6_CYTMA|nr:hypothetical protein VP1G_10391 [Valsa mali var. pyri (nom. inval.)]
MQRRVTLLAVNLKPSAIQTGSARQIMKDMKTTRGSDVRITHGKTRRVCGSAKTLGSGPSTSVPTHTDRECCIDAPGSTAGIRPCDGIDAGNHYCCDDGSDGIGSYACCDNSSDVFILGSSIPSVVALMPLSQTSTSTTASATGIQSSSAPAGTSSSGSVTSSETAVGLGVGLGVGIPVSVAVAGLIWFFTWRARREDHQRRGAAIESSYDAGSGQSGGVAGMASIQGYSQVPQHQQPGLHAAADGLSKYEVDGGTLPQEMQTPLPPVELPGTLRTELP